MEDISREECEKILNTIWLACGSKSMCLNTTTEEIRKCCQKAISDMAKIDKIEEIISRRKVHSEDLIAAYCEIEQILKE